MITSRSVFSVSRVRVAGAKSWNGMIEELLPGTSQAENISLDCIATQSSIGLISTNLMFFAQNIERN